MRQLKLERYPVFYATSGETVLYNITNRLGAGDEKSRLVYLKRTWSAGHATCTPSVALMIVDN